MESWVDNGKSYYKITKPDEDDWFPGEFLIDDHERNSEFIVRSYTKNELTIETARNFHASHNTVWGINARNREQNFALNLLMDPEIDFVSLLGIAGTGKTLLTLAAALEQTLEKNLYREIIMTRATIPIGEEIGFLPGTEEEKMAPWMGALMDNLEVLTNTDNADNGGEWGRAATNDLLSKRIKLRSITFMRGRTFLNRFIIIDEAQNLTPKQLKTLVTRAGPGTKVVCLGNVAQIDTPYLTETTSGLTYTVDRFKKWQHSGHVTLRRGERSRLADYASDEL
ncbi:MAG: PhoH family protein [Gammaproteobacteria bacterium]